MGYVNKKYDDTEVRNFAIEFIKIIFGLNFKSHKNLRGIDLINEDDETFGIELERGGWVGNLWENDYSIMSNLKERTINIPIRKKKYWFDKKKDIFLPNKNKHWFVRTNKDFTQVIVIKPTIIKNLSKNIPTEFKPNNSNRIEKWMSFKKEDVLTYNFKNGKWKKQKKK